MKFGIYTNEKKDPNMAATKKVMAAIRKKGREPYLDEETAKALGEPRYLNAKEADILFVLGGDGTILRAARQYMPYDIKIVGINIGRLGFMSEIGTEDVCNFIDKIAGGEYTIDERLMLEAHAKGLKEPLYALNDFVINHQNTAKMIQLDMYVNGVLAENYYGDGLIVATPTGSTAYSLSAGGPIVAPYVDCIVVTPVCPHSLYGRSIVIASRDTVKVCSQAEKSDIAITADGFSAMRLKHSEVIEIMRSEKKARFLRLEGEHFFPTLKEKLMQWNTPYKTL